MKTFKASLLAFFMVMKSLNPTVLGFETDGLNSKTVVLILNTGVLEIILCVAAPKTSDLGIEMHCMRL